MSRSSANGKSSVRLVWLLIGSFALTIASFVAATLLSERRARGIQTAAESITTNALPSVACYTRTRTELRQLEMSLERLTGGDVPERAFEPDPATIRRASDDLRKNWSTCLALPKYPEEERVQQAISARAGELTTSIEGVLRSVSNGDRPAALHELYSETEPMIDRIDAKIVETISLNVHQSSILGDHIARLRTQAETMMAFLMALSTVLATTAALMMAWVLRRFTTLMEARVTEMERFAGRVAHDIRSPLSAIGIALDLAKRNPQQVLERGVIDRATRTLQRIVQLVDGLLVFARAGATSPKGSEADIADVLDGVVEEMRPLANDSGITLELERPMSSGRVACTPGVLISLVSNLVGNAIKHMGGSPVRQVTIRTCDLDASVRFEVRDTGPGIPPDVRPRIFDPYVRAAASTIPGLGLGLATVRRLVETHGGSVGIGPSRELGSCFWFELPKPEAQQRRTSRFGLWPRPARPSRAR